LPKEIGFKCVLYNTTKSRKKLYEKKVLKKNLSKRELGHLIAKDMWIALMGNQSPYPSKLCYIKRIWYIRNYFSNELCTCDFDGSNEMVLLTTSRVVAAPYLSSNLKNPFIVYSKFTDTNVRLVSVDLFGRSNPVVDFDWTSVYIS